MVVMPSKVGAPERCHGRGRFEPPKASRRLKNRRRVVTAAPDPPDPLLSHVLSAEPRISGVLFLGWAIPSSAEPPPSKAGTGRRALDVTPTVTLARTSS